MEDIQQLWPDDIDARPIRTPFRILEEQAWRLPSLVGGGIHASVKHGVDYDPAMPFSYALILEEKRDIFNSPLAYMVVAVRHRADIYPVEVKPGDLMLETEEDFLDFVRERLASSDVRQAIQIMLAANSPEIYCENLLPESYDLRPIRTPYRILREQEWDIKDKTNGLVIGSVNVEKPHEESMIPHFCFSFTIHPGSAETDLFNEGYTVLEVEHGPEIYPLVVRPGDITLNSEREFVEFIRQELASPEVRQAVRIIASDG